MITRQQAATALDRILRDILLYHEDSPAVLALEEAGITNLIDFMSLRYEVVPTLVYQTGKDEKPKSLKPNDVGMIQTFITYGCHLMQANRGVLSIEQWDAITREEFDDFRIRGPAPQSTATPIGSPLSRPTPKQADPVAEFKKGIKRDASLYPILKDQNQWANWNRAVISQARAHDVQEVFNTSYRPTTMEEVQLFDQKKSFVYAVFNKVVQTDIGKSYVREHEDDYDAQEVYRKLLNFAKASTKSEFTKDKLVEFMTTAKLDSRWKGSNEGFILYWKEQMRLFEDLTPRPEHYAPNAKKRMIEAAVRNIPELKAVKDIDNNRIAHGETPLSYDAYLDVLMSAAVTRDQTLGLTAEMRAKRVVNLNDLTYDRSDDYGFDQGYVDAGGSYFEDSANQIAIHQVAHRPAPRRENKTVFMPREIWDLLPEGIQAKIKAWNFENKSPNSKPPPRRVNEHELTASDELTASLEEDHEFPQVDPTNLQENSELAIDNAEILAHITKQKPLPPGHTIRSLLASTHNNRSANNNNVGPRRNPQDQAKAHVIIDGKRYVQASTHRLKYNIAAHQKTVNKVSSLVDRGANGGLAGEDVRLIEQTARCANVSGINDHTIEGLPISTVAGVVESQLGPICLIIHQYAYHGKGKMIHSCIQVEDHGNDVNN